MGRDGKASPRTSGEHTVNSTIISGQHTNPLCNSKPLIYVFYGDLTDVPSECTLRVDLLQLPVPTISAAKLYWNSLPFHQPSPDHLCTRPPCSGVVLTFSVVPQGREIGSIFDKFTVSATVADEVLSQQLVVLALLVRATRPARRCGGLTASPRTGRRRRSRRRRRPWIRVGLR